MSSSKQGRDLYRPIIKDGTHLAPSKKTPGAVRGAQLSDANNELDGQAEWVKVEEDEDEYSYSPYAYEEQREPVELTEEQRVFAAMVSEAIAAGTIWVLSEVVAPRVKSWWQEKAVPGIKKAWQSLSEKKPPKKATGKPKLRAAQIIESKPSVPGLFSHEIEGAYENYMNNMTSEEAQRELLDIFILSAIVAQKIKRLSNSRIVDDGNPQIYIEGSEVAAKLSTPQFVSSINTILRGNTILLEEKAAELSAILGRSLVVNGEYVPIENNALREAFALNI